MMASALRKGGWGNTRGDVCTFARHSETPDGLVEAIASLIIVHVGDLAISTNKTDLERLRMALAQFKTGPIFDMGKEKHLEYFG